MKAFVFDERIGLREPDAVLGDGGFLLALRALCVQAVCRASVKSAKKERG